MSQKHKNRRQSEPAGDTVVQAPESRDTGKIAEQSQKTVREGSAEEPGGLTWQPILVFAMLGLGLIVVVAKILGLF